MLERRKVAFLSFIFIWGIIFMWLIKTFVISLEIVKGVSMLPGYREESIHIANMFIYNFAEPARSDVIAIKGPRAKGDQLIKRVIGVPGDIIEMKGGDVYLNGELLHEPYVKGKTYPDRPAFEVKKNMYFVMGDNREFSSDSRGTGLISRSEIKGRIAPGNK